MPRIRLLSKNCTGNAQIYPKSLHFVHRGFQTTPAYKRFDLRKERGDSFEPRPQRYQGLQTKLAFRRRFNVLWGFLMHYPRRVDPEGKVICMGLRRNKTFCGRAIGACGPGVLAWSPCSVRDTPAAIFCQRINATHDNASWRARRRLYTRS